MRRKLHLVDAAHWNENHITFMLANSVRANACLFLKGSEHIVRHTNLLCMNRVAGTNKNALLAKEFRKSICILPSKHKPVGQSTMKDIPCIGDIHVQSG
jgi:hypothetical protein